MLSTSCKLQRLKCFAAALLFVVSVFQSAFADSTNDQFVLGYATAILEQQFKVQAGSLQVKDGVITIMAKDLPATERERAITVLKEIKGVTHVDIIDGDKQPTPAPVVVQQPDRAAVELGETRPEGGEFLPSGRLFEPLIADPRTPHFSIGYQNYLHDNQLENVVAVSLGTTMGLYENNFFGAGRWQFAVQGAVFAIFDLDAPSFDLVNADYWLGLPFTYRVNSFSASLRLFHQSSHLGDEFLLRVKPDRVNVSYEGVELKLSQDFFKRILRIYGGGSYLPHRNPPEIEEWAAQAGIELRSPRGLLSKHVKPVCGFDAQVREESDWNVDYSARAGVQFDSEKLRDRQLQIMLEYYNGRSPNGQFFVKRVEYWGIGFHFYYD
jgi:hypothetical protein